MAKESPRDSTVVWRSVAESKQLVPGYDAFNAVCWMDEHVGMKSLVPRAYLKRSLEALLSYIPQTGSSASSMPLICSGSCHMV